ncbi:MAG: uncharacterized protein A8A55_1632 [Amphiamblys sp. WSBS2006]|nr:MAG: uncharacterized protein A8A55_1632 [Amphiamblys sp. WSBS2006]
MGYSYEDDEYQKEKTKSSKLFLFLATVVGILLGFGVGWALRRQNLGRTDLDKRVGISIKEHVSFLEEQKKSLEDILDGRGGKINVDSVEGKRRKWVELYIEMITLGGEGRLKKLQECLEAKGLYDEDIKQVEDGIRSM